MYLWAVDKLSQLALTNVEGRLSRSEFMGMSAACVVYVGKTRSCPELFSNVMT